MSKKEKKKKKKRCPFGVERQRKLKKKTAASSSLFTHHVALVDVGSLLEQEPDDGDVACFFVGEERRKRARG